MLDVDGDGYGDMNPPSNTDIVEGSDCDDDDNFTYPGAAYLDSESICLTDADEDGYGADDSIPPLYEMEVTSGDVIEIVI